MLYYAVLYYINCAALYYTIPYNTILHNTILLYTTLHYTILYDSVTILLYLLLRRRHDAFLVQRLFPELRRAAARTREMVSEA